MTAVQRGRGGLAILLAVGIACAFVLWKAVA